MFEEYYYAPMSGANCYDECDNVMGGLINGCLSSNCTPESPEMGQMRAEQFRPLLLHNNSSSYGALPAGMESLAAVIAASLANPD